MAALNPATVVLVVAAVVLSWRYRRDVVRDRVRRAVFFERTGELFQSFRITQADGGYPVLLGRYRGHDVRLEPVLDTLAWRKLPSLWLKVAILTPNPVRGVLDLLVRPQGIEFYSPSGGLDVRVPLPSGWPEDAILCTDDPAELPPLDQLGRHVSIFDDPQMKELVVTPHGTRLVRQIWQAERAYYSVLRQVRFPEDRLDLRIARTMLDAALAITASLASVKRVAA